MEPTTLAENEAERKHLITLAKSLSEVELKHPMSAGWTVSAVLAHLAFWDLRAVVLLEKWAVGGAGDSPVDIDVINDATLPLCLALPVSAAVTLVIDAAEKVDRMVAGLSPAQIADVEKNGTGVRLNRAHHRKSHLAEIEQVLGK